MKYLEILGNPAVWLGVGQSAGAIAVSALLVSLVVKHRKLRVVSSASLLVAFVLYFGALKFGDWSISECYNSEGEFVANDAQCQYP